MKIRLASRFTRPVRAISCCWRCYPSAARVHTVSYKLRRGAAETPLLLLLRKYARDARLTAITQPDPTERVLQIQLEHAEAGATTLVVELIGRQPNALLLNPAGRILECLHHLPAVGEGRALLPGRSLRTAARARQIAAARRWQRRLLRTTCADRRPARAAVEGAGDGHRRSQPDGGARDRLARATLTPAPIKASMCWLWRRRCRNSGRRCRTETGSPA
jgi:hypothetical protein